MQCDNKNSWFAVDNVKHMLKELKVHIVNNDNILIRKLGIKGLHLNPYSEGRLSMNHIAEKITYEKMRVIYMKKIKQKLSDPAEENPGTFSKEVEESPWAALRKIILSNINRIIIEDINIKSIRNKFEILSSVIEK